MGHHLAYLISIIIKIYPKFGPTVGAIKVYTLFRFNNYN